MYKLYSIGWYLLLPLVSLRLFIKSIHNPNYRKRWKERLGFFKKLDYKETIWIHAVSVGEVIAAIPLINKIREMCPNIPIVVTTMTPTGSERVTNLLKNEVFHVYIPYDMPLAIDRFLKNTKPKLAIFIETEIWPNIIRICQEKHIKLLIANARLSQKSARAYARLNFFFKHILANVYIASQGSRDAKRFKCLGVPKDHIFITGNLKYDLNVSNDIEVKGNVWRSLFKDRFLFIAASTHEGEEEIILNAYKTILIKHPKTFLILAPRHPERTKKILQLCELCNLTPVLRTNITKDTKFTDSINLLIVDTIGELMGFYFAADLIFIGGSLINHGGHNPLESAIFNKAIISGEYIFNFYDVYQLLAREQGIVFINRNNIVENIEKLIINNQYRKQLGLNANKVLNANKGSLDKHLEIIHKLLAATPSAN